MKRLFLLLFCAIAIAGTSLGYDFRKYRGIMLSSMSPDGKYLLSNSDGSVIILNTAAGDTLYYEENSVTGENYSIGMGNAANNLGMIVGSISLYDPGVWYNGAWTALPLQEGMKKGTNTLANGITPDGKYICGSVSTSVSLGESSNTTYFPCIWEMKEDGTYGEYELLPFPEKDFTGRSPQYITALCISDDGKTVAGQVRCFDGFVNYPIVYTKGDDGKWSYKEYGLGKIVDPDAKFPEYPKVEPKEPKMEDYMTADSIASYNNALERYQDSLSMYYQKLIENRPTRPKQIDFISDKEGYNAAITAYDKAYTAYSDSISAFNEVYYQAWTGASYTFNVVALSANGKYLAQTIEREDPDADPLEPTNMARPAFIDLTSNGEVTETEAKSMSAFSITNDGTIIASSPAVDYTRNAFVISKGTTSPVKFEDWVAERCDTASLWLKKNMLYDVTLYSYDAEGNPVADVVKDSLITGSMMCNPDGTVFLAYAWNYWADSEENAGFTSYVLDITDPDSPTGIAVLTRRDENGNVKISAAEGRISVEGDVASFDVYDMSGRKIGNANGNSGISVSSGLYLIKAKAADGRTVTKKICVRK